MSDSARLEIVLSEDPSNAGSAPEAPEVLSPAAMNPQPAQRPPAEAGSGLSPAAQRPRAQPEDDEGPRVNYLTGKMEDPARNAAEAAQRQKELEDKLRQAEIDRQAEALKEASIRGKAVDERRREIDPDYDALRKQTEERHAAREKAREELEERRLKREKEAAEREDYEKRRAADPTMRAWEASERERHKKESSEVEDLARRGIDPAYAARKAEEEEARRRKEEDAARRERLENDPMEYARDAMRREKEAKEKAEERDRARREVDPEYAKRKANEEARERAGKIRSGLSVAADMARIGSGAANPEGGMGALAGAANLAAQGLTFLGPTGMIAGVALKGATEAIGAFTGAVNSLSERARQLGQYSGAITAATTQADMKSMLADIKEASALGGKYAELISAKSDTDMQLREVMLSLKKVAMEFLVPVLEGLTEMLKLITDSGVLDMLAPIAKLLGQLIKFVTSGFGIPALFRAIRDAVAGGTKDAADAAKRESLGEKQLKRLLESSTGLFQGLRRPTNPVGGEDGPVLPIGNRDFGPLPPGF